MGEYSNLSYNDFLQWSEMYVLWSFFSESFNDEISSAV